MRVCVCEREREGGRELGMILIENKKEVSYKSPGMLDIWKWIY